MTEPKLTLEDRLNEWASQPGAIVTEAEVQFIEDMRKAAAANVGYGWMQQIIEWEWMSKGEGAWGPAYFQAEIARLSPTVRKGD